MKRFAFLTGWLAFSSAFVPGIPSALAATGFQANCTPENLISFGLVPATPPADLALVDKSKISIDQVVQGAFVTPRNHVQNIAIRGCLGPDGQKFLLDHVLFNVSVVGSPTRLDADNADLLMAENLDAAAFGDMAGLHLAFREHRFGGLYHVKGWGHGAGAFVTASVAQDGGRQYYDIVYGRLDIADPFANPRDCRRGGQTGVFRLISKSIGSATIVSEVCSYLGGGRTSHYEFLAVEVTDANPALGQMRGKTVRMDGQELANALLHLESHHNWCDNFYLKVPALGAEYAEIRWPKPLEGYPFAQPTVGVNYGSGWTVEHPVSAPFCRL